MATKREVPRRARWALPHPFAVPLLLHLALPAAPLYAQMNSAPRLAFPMPGDRPAPQVAAPARADVQDADTGRSLELTSMLIHPDAHNAVDAWILEIARSDGNPRMLDERDFLRAMSDVQTARFLSAAAQYVQERWLKGDRSDWRVTEFLQEVKKLNLPPFYTIFLLHGHTDVGQLRRGLVRAEVGPVWMWGHSPLQGQNVDWNVAGPTLGVGVEWPWRADPYQTTWPLGYAGLGAYMSQGTGSIVSAGTNLGSVDYFGLDFLVHASARYTLNPSVTLQATAATGFGIGTMRVKRREFDGDTALTDPCAADANAGLSLNAATQAVRCTVTNAFGIFYSLPVEGSVGASFWGWFDLRAGMSWNAMSVDPAVWAPARLWMGWLRAGIVLR